VKLYWDTSAAINAIVSKQVWDRLSADEHFTRLHLFSEVFATMTGRGIPVKDALGNPARLVMSARDATAWLRKFSGKVNLVELDLAETLDALDQAHGKGVQGGRVYDYGHAKAAAKSKADLILTRNTQDFQALVGSMRVEWP
jgi:hypothetical protein